MQQSQPAGGTGFVPQQMTYEQFQEQQRIRQEQEQAMAREALLRAGADRYSDRLRTLLVELQNLNAEIARAENQVQVQMDAQLRQLQAIRERVRQAEHAMQSVLSTSPGIRQ
ncbi:Uncharacterized protein TXXE_08135 [Thermobacillus xylanilyticus]|jgi:hypothetical protein|uniref:Uncharacterized protein n=2 Tax=Thermobacillus TaxID=76632 RepID=L0EBV7_THECK|nr:MULTISPECIES: hypothetical protein [Thermobacillus]AGA57748.1 hypothetical protein Theco_1610 [Thermobacillus composti KWC4]REJ11445.1 MAG: hypothetical protein C6W59_17545 [Paenibacillaceae bacterium]CAG5084769.1 Uncharacterized protein TXXE_08135 [Thermobacillus xylanilyticus]